MLKRCFALALVAAVMAVPMAAFASEDTEPTLIVIDDTNMHVEAGAVPPKADEKDVKVLPVIDDTDRIVEVVTKEIPVIDDTGWIVEVGEKVSPVIDDTDRIVIVEPGDEFTDQVEKLGEKLAERSKVTREVRETAEGSAQMIVEELRQTMRSTQRELLRERIAKVLAGQFSGWDVVAPF